MRPFDHERLHVYRAAIDFLGWSHELLTRSRRLHPFLQNQLLRSATSITLNIAEGAGEHSRRDKARFYRIARRSATESAATLDILAVLGHVSPEQIAAPKTQLPEIAALLTAMARNLESPTPPRQQPPTQANDSSAIDQRRGPPENRGAPASHGPIKT